MGNLIKKTDGILFFAGSLFCMLFCFLLCTLFCCCANAFFDETEEITFLIPQWPPEGFDNLASPESHAACAPNNADSSESCESCVFPELYKRKISIVSSAGCKTFYTAEKSVTVAARKNDILSVLAEPLVFAGKSSSQALQAECCKNDVNVKICESCKAPKIISFFMPAGAVYPHCTGTGSCQQLTWEQGFTAFVLAQILIQNNEAKVLAARFNWQKFNDTICKKIAASADSETLGQRDETAFYNPWLLLGENQKQLFDGICSMNFKASLLNLKGVYSVNVNELFYGSAQARKVGGFPLTSFVPENKIIMGKKVISAKKDSQLLVLNNDFSTGTVLKLDAKKNILQEQVFLPIINSKL